MTKHFFFLLLVATFVVGCGPNKKVQQGDKDVTETLRSTDEAKIHNPPAKPPSTSPSKQPPTPPKN